MTGSRGQSTCRTERAADCDGPEYARGLGTRPVTVFLPVDQPPLTVDAESDT